MYDSTCHGEWPWVIARKMATPMLFALAVACEPASSAEPLPEQASKSGTRRDPAVLVSWNELAYEIAYAEDQFLTFKGQRALAMMNLAVHDALNSITPEYDRYVYRGPRHAGADPIAAAAQAAHGVLLAQYPGAQSRLDSALANGFGERADTPPRRRAASLGAAVAAAVIAAREGDDWDLPGSYEFGSGPGRYQTTPGWDGFVLQPGFRMARPFVIGAVQAFRPPPPPSLHSDAYAHAFDEVKAYGAAQREVRTADQTGYAVWWMEFSEGSVNRLARRLVTERRMDAWTAARMFAYLHLALYDAYIATWDSKYTYDHWRPYTAIREAAGDGNAMTAPDSAWESLRQAPPFPEYVSAHAAGCAAAFSVLAHTLSDSTAFTMTTITAPATMPSRSFPSFSAAAAECADSRVQLGWHFRYSTDAGLALGRRVAGHILENVLGGR